MCRWGCPTTDTVILPKRKLNIILTKIIRLIRVNGVARDFA